MKISKLTVWCSVVFVGLALVSCKDSNPVNNNPPSVPVLLSPSNNATGVTVIPALTWETVSGTASYRVQVSTSSVFEMLEVDDSAITTNTMNIVLMGGTTCYWRVKAKNIYGTSAWSLVGNFTTLVPVPTQLEGTWEGVNRNGSDQTQWKYIMINDSITILADSVMKIRGIFSIDTMANPKTIDIAIVNSSNAAYVGKRILGLYDLAGNVLNITATDPATPRPASMSAAPVLGLFQQ
jgi:uncharacterized protein (TIGR03067 family)